jgi:hypothetical protein
MESMLNRQVRQQQPDLLMEAVLGAQAQYLAPEIRAEVRRLLKQLLTEYVGAGAPVERVDE